MFYGFLLPKNGASERNKNKFIFILFFVKSQAKKAKNKKHIMYCQCKLIYFAKQMHDICKIPVQDHLEVIIEFKPLSNVCKNK